MPAVAFLSSSHQIEEGEFPCNHGAFALVTRGEGDTIDERLASLEALYYEHDGDWCRVERIQLFGRRAYNVAEGVIARVALQLNFPSGDRMHAVLLLDGGAPKSVMIGTAALAMYPSVDAWVRLAWRDYQGITMGAVRLGQLLIDGSATVRGSLGMLSYFEGSVSGTDEHEGEAITVGGVAIDSALSASRL